MASEHQLTPFLLLLLTLFSSLHIAHARDSQFFSKLPTTTNTVPPEEHPSNNQQQPVFVPENDNTYDQESDNVTPSSATTTIFPDEMESKESINKYLPKNYNPVAYVTQPENTGYENINKEEYPPTIAANSRNNYDNFYGGGSSFNSDPLANEKYFNNGGTNGYQPQGMSDTRSLESGKYFYDVNSEKYSSNHPYTKLSGVRARNEYSESENAYDQFNGENTIGGYSNQDDFQDEEDNGLP